MYVQSGTGFRNWIFYSFHTHWLNGQWQKIRCVYLLWRSYCRIVMHNFFIRSSFCVRSAWPCMKIFRKNLRSREIRIRDDSVNSISVSINNSWKYFEYRKYFKMKSLMSLLWNKCSLDSKPSKSKDISDKSQKMTKQSKDLGEKVHEEWGKFTKNTKNAKKEIEDVINSVGKDTDLKQRAKNTMDILEKFFQESKDHKEVFLTGLMVGISSIFLVYGMMKMFCWFVEGN